MAQGILKYKDKTTGEWVEMNTISGLPNIQDLSNYYIKQEVDDKITPLATKAYVDDAVANISSGGTIDMTDYYNIETIDIKLGDIDTRITNLSESINNNSFDPALYYTIEDIHKLDKLLINDVSKANNITTFTSAFVNTTFVKDSELITKIKHNDITQPGTHTTFYTSADADTLFIKSGEVVTIDQYNSLVNSLDSRITSITTSKINEYNTTLQTTLDSIINDVSTNSDNITILTNKVNALGNGNSSTGDTGDRDYYTKDEIKELFYGRTTNGDNIKF